LRERLTDLPDLCTHFIHQIAQDQDIIMGPEEIDAICAYAWPGNVRELRNVIERAILVRHGCEIFPSRLLKPNGNAPQFPEALSADQTLLTLKELEKNHIRKTLARLEGNHTHTAKALGISRSTLLRKIQAFQIN
jgi:transcriptional regulator with PAS, ATPase and Fis domain